MKKILTIVALVIGVIASAQESKEIQFEGEPENMGPMVNSEFDDLSPKISPDGNTLFITRYPANNSGKNNIWVCYKKSDGTWTKAKNIGTPLNAPGYSTSVQAITPDGNTILLSNIYRYFDGTVSGGGCSVSFRQRGGWSFPKQQNIDKFENKNQYVGYFMTNDRQFILMAIEKKKGLGQKDIWVSRRANRKDHEWTKPVNLGPIVNTKGDEGGIFMAADGKTMFFSSDGHGGYGSKDVFMTKRLDETWTNWSKPVNLGPKINTADFDSYFTIDAAGEYAYFVSNKSGYGKGDIFRIKLPSEAKPDPVVLVYGKVLDKKTGKPIQAKIRYEELPSGDEIGVASTSPEDGVYKIILPFGKKYGFMATSDKYYAISDNLDLTDLKEYKEIERNLYLSPIEVGEVVRLNNIFFDFGKATLLETSFPELKRVIKLMTENPTIEIELSGHTDNVGSDNANLTLSQDRAQAVVDYLAASGIKKNRILAKGYGETAPVASNDTDEGRQLNRRVEFKILKR